MKDREKLYFLIQDSAANRWFPNNAEMLKLANHLIANGVTVQKHGRWKQARYTEAPLYFCSECDKQEYKQHRYCPSCGAKMDLKE